MNEILIVFLIFFVHVNFPTSRSDLETFGLRIPPLFICRYAIFCVSTLCDTQHFAYLHCAIRNILRIYIVRYAKFCVSTPTLHSAVPSTLLLFRLLLSAKFYHSNHYQMPQYFLITSLVWCIFLERW